MADERLKKQIQFILEVDKIKNIFRMTKIHDGSAENDAEHSWHLALMAFLLSEYSKADKIDILKVMKMCIVHDIVEIDAGIPSATIQQQVRINLSVNKKQLSAFSAYFPKTRPGSLKGFGKNLRPWKPPRPSMLLHWTDCSL